MQVIGQDALSIDVKRSFTARRPDRVVEGIPMPNQDTPLSHQKIHYKQSKYLPELGKGDSRA
jgi:hypothetical protein